MRTYCYGKRGLIGKWLPTAALACLMCIRPVSALAGSPPDGMDGGSFHRPVHVPHLTAQQRESIRQTLEWNRASLTGQGILPVQRAASGVQPGLI